LVMGIGLVRNYQEIISVWLFHGFCVWFFCTVSSYQP
jgi:hypothetical protein